MAFQKKPVAIEDPHNTNFYVKRSQQKLRAGYTSEALDDAYIALQKSPGAFDASLQECNCVYDQNKFEHNLLDLSQKTKRFVGHRSRAFALREQIIITNLDDSLGEKAGHCLLGQENDIMKLYRQDKAKNRMERPLWKMLREQNLCDVISELEIKEQELSRKAAARSEQNWKVYVQTYVPRGWKDISFLKSLKTNPLLNLCQTQTTNAILNSAVSENYKKTLESVQMLNARCPLYAQKLKRFGTTKAENEFKKRHLFRIQAGTRRVVFNQLDHLKMLRKQGQLEKLAMYAEKILEQYFELKTLRVMPRKLEFVNEICNIVALSYADTVQIPFDMFRTEKNWELLSHLFNIKSISKDTGDIVNYKFGDKSTYRDPTFVDLSYLKQKNHLSRLDKIIQNSKCATEQAFFYHQIAEIQCKQNKLDETRVFAKKVIERAIVGKNHLWHFLGIFMLCKTFVIQKKVEELQTHLYSALEMLPNLTKTRDRFYQLIEMAIEINYGYMQSIKEAKN